MTFDILKHLSKLEPDGGRDEPNGDHSYLCPACGSSNFKVNINSGKWASFGCDCANTESGKRKIREALSPASAPVGNNVTSKQTRPQRQRSWDYFTPVTLERSQPALTVHRTDDGKGKKKIRQESHIHGYEPKEIKEKVLPYGLPEALKALEDGTPYVFWVEGEPCVDSLRALGLSAVTSIGGAGKFKPARDANHIPADRLVVVPDRDKPGMDHMETVAEHHPGCQWLFPFPNTPEWNGSMPATGGLDIADWIQLGATTQHILDGIGDKPAAELSGEAQGDIRDEFLRDAEALKKRLDHGLTQIDQLPAVASRSVALHTLKEHLGLNQQAFTTLVQALSEAKAPKAEESFDDLMAEDDEELTALVEDLFPAGLVLIAAEGFAGKSNTAYQIAEAVTNGSKFAGQFQCQKAPALIIQMDESKTDAKRKFKVLGLRPAKGALTIKWQFSPMMFPELRGWVTETGAKLLVLDSLMTIAGGQISPKDAEFGLLIYRLNQLAAELGLTIICLHHVVKGNSKRTEIYKEDIFGTAYVYNGSSEAWGLWQAREDGTPEPLFNLRNLKSRSGLVDGGVTYQFEGNDEDKRLSFRGMAGRTITLNEIKSARDRVAALLQNAHGAALDPKAVNDRLQLGNADYARRLCRELFEKPSVPVGRKFGKSKSAGGRPGYLYFWDPA